MVIDVILKKEDIISYNLSGNIVVAIDILRATTTMVNAFKNGCQEIIAVSSIEEAFYLKKLYGDRVVLGGERNRERVPGFDLGNSPREYTPEKIGGKVVVFTTTNGTDLINRCAKAKNILIGSFLNAGAIVNYLAEEEKIIFACAGTRGYFSLEDYLFAGYLSYLLQKKYNNIILSDQCQKAVMLFKIMENDLEGILEKTPHGQALIDIGLNGDIAYCVKKNIVDIVPKVKGNGFFIRIQG